MIPLAVSGNAIGVEEHLVGLVSSSSSISDTRTVTSSNKRQCILVEQDSYRGGRDVPYVVASHDHLNDGDIVLVHPNGKIETLYRAGSEHNTLFLTHRCNSNCLMCSQPPRDIDDLEFFFRINSELIGLLPKDLRILGITGGEPTLLGPRLAELLRVITRELPEAGIHILTNGRALAWKEFASTIAAAANGNMVLGIPLYSDSYALHDYVVQARDAFHQTLLGLHNCARFGIRVEIRVVVHRQTYFRLPKLAEFIQRNLPFVEHVALMGLEYTGYTPHNDELLWMEPTDYSTQLSQAASYLDHFGMNVSIYNIPLCLLPSDLHRFSRKSISDWKRDYLPECDLCLLKSDCGGLFGTSSRQSGQIKPFLTA